MKAIHTAAVAGSLALLLAGCNPSQPAPAPAPTPGTVTVTTTVEPPDPNSTDVAPTAGVMTPVPSTVAAPTRSASGSMPWAMAPTSAVAADPRYDFNIATTRVGDHNGYDRVVIELTGGSAAQATWLVEYVTEPIEQGRGDVIAMAGSAWLRIIVRGLAMPPDPVLSGAQPGSAHGVVASVYIDPVFEGQAQVFVGLDRPRGFVVSTLDAPTRIVIDIQDA